MMRIVFVQLLVAILAVQPVFASCVPAMPGAPASFSEVRRSVVLYLDRLNTVGGGVDEILGGKLGEISSHYGIVWWKVFGDIIAAEAVLRDLGDGNYSSAVARLARYQTMGLLSSTGLARATGGASAIAGLAALPIELALFSWADMVSESGFRFQARAYRAARTAPYNLTHRQIMQRFQPDATVMYDGASGFLMAVGEVVPGWYRPFRPDARVAREDVYAFLRLAFEQEPQRRLMESHARDVMRRFQDSMAEPDLSDIPSISGSWSGYSTAGSLRLDYAWVIEQSGSCVSGTISLAREGSGNWSRYSFEGEISGNAVVWRGTVWQTSGNGSFCLASGTLGLSPSDNGLVLSGNWGPNAVIGGCPQGNSGLVWLRRQ